MASVAVVFGWLAGRWTFDRMIEPGVGTVTGTASLRQVAPCRLHYREDGRISLATGYTAPVCREYVYVLERDQILVCFADGEQPGGLLHEFRLEDAPEAGVPAAGPGTWGTDVHHCGDDAYQGTYHFEGPDRFTVLMRVTGPAKDYRMITSYRRRIVGTTEST